MGWSARRTRADVARRRTRSTAAVVLACLPGCTETTEVAVTRPAPPAAAAATRAEPAVGVTVDDPGLPVKTRDGWIRGGPLPADARFTRDFYRRVVADQLALYPGPLLKRIGLARVVLCTGLRFEGTTCPAFADVERGRLYLNLDGAPDAGVVARTVHHEVFHQVDYADDRRLDADPLWEALNPPGFRYTGDPERLVADPDATRLDADRAGFLNRYATSSPAEDKAELYSYLVVDPAMVRGRADGDGVLRRKVERLRATLDGLVPGGRALIGP